MGMPPLILDEIYQKGTKAMEFEQTIREWKALSQRSPMKSTWLKFREKLIDLWIKPRNVKVHDAKNDDGISVITTPEQLLLDFDFMGIDRPVVITGKMHLKYTRLMIIKGPCVVTANLTAAKEHETITGETVVFLYDRATLINTSRLPAGEGNIRYFVGEGCYLNFPNYPKGKELPPEYVVLSNAGHAYACARGPENVEELLRERSDLLGRNLERILFDCYNQEDGFIRENDPAAYFMSTGALDRAMGIPETCAVGWQRLMERRDDRRRPHCYDMLFECRKFPEEERFPLDIGLPVQADEKDEDGLSQLPTIHSSRELNAWENGFVGRKYACYDATGIKRVKGTPIMETKGELLDWLAHNMPGSRKVSFRIPLWMEYAFEFDWQKMVTCSGKKLIVCREHDFCPKGK